MRKRAIVSLTIVLYGLTVSAQPCGVSQSLTASQQANIQNVLGPLDKALHREDLSQIDSLSTVLKNQYATQGGLPAEVEPYYRLVSSSQWLDVSGSIELSRKLVASDSIVYVQLWKMAKGMKPPLYQPHSLFLRSSAEIALGLLKIASKETDETRKKMYQSCATRALDTLATMQIKSGTCAGAFPFPDLRTYHDPVFSPIIQKFMLASGADSTRVIADGWIVNDRETGEFKFDAGVIANAYYEAYQYTGKTEYKNIAIAVANYLKPLKFNINYNYNTFVSLGLTRAFQLTNDTTYLSRAIVNLRYAVYPGQVARGRWVDGHNAQARYHSLIIQNIVPTIGLLPVTGVYATELYQMTQKAVRCFVASSFSCNSATGFRWLLKAYTLPASPLPASLRDSLSELIGNHINQSALNGKYVDIPTLGEYIELLQPVVDNKEVVPPARSSASVFPNPAHDIAHIAISLPDSDTIEAWLSDIHGQYIMTIDKGLKAKGTHHYQIDLSRFNGGMYVITIATSSQTHVQKLLKDQ